MAISERPKIDWVDVPAGIFKMGAPVSEDIMKDKFLHEVTLSGFKMSKYPITFDQYDVYCEATGLSKPDDNGWGRGNMPVINVSWIDANAFAKWLDCSLPTEAQWEYACRAGSTTPFNTGNCLDTNLVNFDGNFPYKECKKGESRTGTTPVDYFQPNAFGLYDMHGNVWEWCKDWYDDQYYQNSEYTNPAGPKNGTEHVLRGGGWNSRAEYCRSANRSYSYYRGNSVGFRIVMNH
jgi:sulfatase modifying factor 1